MFRISFRALLAPIPLATASAATTKTAHSTLKMTEQKHEKESEKDDPCEQKRIAEQRWLTAINETTAPRDLEHAKQRAEERERLGAELARCDALCKEKEEKQRQDRIRENEKAAAIRASEDRARIRDNAPVFFNFLGDLVEKNDHDMCDALLRHVERTNDDNRIVVFSTSEWEQHAFQALPRDVQDIFPYSDRSNMVFQSFSRKMERGAYAGWTLRGEHFWKMSILIIPTSEQRIVLEKTRKSWFF